MKATRMLLALFAVVAISACNGGRNITSPDPKSAPQSEGTSPIAPTGPLYDGGGGYYGSGG